MSKITDPQGFEGRVNYHKKNIQCAGCGKDFSTTVKEEEYSSESYCFTCFGMRFGVAQALQLYNKMFYIDKYFWEIPYTDTSEEMRAKVNWVTKQ